MLIAVLADLQIAGKIDDLTDNGFHASRIRLAVDRSADGGGAPRIGRFVAELAHGLRVGSAISCGSHLRLKDFGLSSLGLSNHGQGQRERGQNTEQTYG